MGLFSSLFGKGHNKKEPSSRENCAPKEGSVAKEQLASYSYSEVMKAAASNIIGPEELYLYCCKTFQLTPYKDLFYYWSVESAFAGHPLVAVCNNGCIYGVDENGISRIALTSITALNLDTNIPTYIPVTLTTVDGQQTYTFKKNGPNEDFNDGYTRFANDAMRLATWISSYFDKMKGDPNMTEESLYSIGGINFDAMYPQEKIAQANKN